MRPPEQRRAGARRALVVLLAAPISCIIPDYKIKIVGGLANPGAVRVIERIPLPLEMLELCLKDEDEPSGEDDFCHQVAATSQPSGLIRPSEGDFCICPKGERDMRAIPSFTIFAEDPDVAGDEAKDTLHGVLLLDPDPSSSDPRDAVAYEKYLKCGPGRKIPYQVRDRDPEISVETRDPIAHWEFRLDDGSGRGWVDLCNGNGDRQLERGLHNLQFMVTDRPFFRPILLDAEGMPIFDESGQPLLGDEQCGVPDIANGATYSTIYFVFECDVDDDASDEDNCDCQAVEP